MSKNYAALAQSVVGALGGVGNITAVTHCMTRLRFVLKDEAQVDSATLKGISGVMGVVRNDNQCQVIIGNTVSQAFREVVRRYPACCAGWETEAHLKTHRRRDPRRADRHHVAADPRYYRRIDG